MPIVTKKYSFDYSLQGIYDTGASSTISLNHDNTDGYPSSGCAKWSIDNFAGTSFEVAKTSVANSWLDFGLPIGSNVLSIQLKSFRFKQDFPSCSGYLRIRMISGASNALSGYLVNNNLLQQTIGWSLGTVNGSQNVLGSYQAVTTAIQLEIELGVTSAGGLNTICIDELELEITYDGGCPQGYNLTELNKTITQTFVSDLETYSIFGSPPGGTINWQNDGSPSPGCLQIVTTSSAIFCSLTSSKSWLDYNIPHDAKLLKIRLKSVKIKSNTNLSNAILTLTVIDSTSSNNISDNGNDIYNVILNGNFDWQNFSSNQYLNIHTDYDDPSLTIKLKICIDTSQSIDLRIDSIEYEIIYEHCVLVGGTKMPERMSQYEIAGFGIETTPGIAVAATKRFLCTNIDVDPELSIRTYKPRGFAHSTDKQISKSHTTFRYDGALCYNDLIYIFSSLINKPAPSTPANNSIYTITGASGTLGFSVVDGADTQVLAAATFASAAALQAAMEALTNVGKGNVIVTSSAAGSYKIEFVGSRSMAGLVINTPTGTPSPTITVGSSSAGTSRLWTFINNYNAPATIQTYTFEKGMHGVANYGQQFAHSVFSSANLKFSREEASIQGEGFGYEILESPDSPFTITSLTPSNDVPSAPIDPRSVSVWLNNASYVDPGASADNLGRLLRPLECDINIGDRSAPVYTLNDQDTSFSAITETGPNVTSRLVVEHDAQGQQLASMIKRNPIQYFTLESRGKAISGSGNAAWIYRMRIQLPMMFTQVDRGDTQGVYSSTFSGESAYNNGTGKGAYVGGFRADVQVGFASL